MPRGRQRRFPRTETHQICTKCLRNLPFADYPHRDGKPTSWCKRCLADRLSVLHLKKQLEKFGATAADYDAMLVAQNGKCAICGLAGKPSRPGGRSLHVDHCHKTNKFRGLLCGHCNRGIGIFFESVDYLQAAIEYLEKHSAPELVDA